MAEGPSAQGLVIRSERLLARLADFASIGATPGGGVDRQALTEGDRAARALLAGLGRARGFAVAQDHIANLFLRREGRNPDLPPLLVGSHLDTQPSGGRYDGALGVLAAFEVLEALEDGGVTTGRPVVLVAWTNEEGSRFAPGAMGSRAFAERLPPEIWQDVVDGAGLSFRDALDATLGALDAPVVAAGFPVHAYLELHIEQGPVLEREGIPIGVVTGIQGVRWLDVRIEGRSAHAGTTPLAFRHDPLAAAAAAIHVLAGRIMPGDADARFTVGRIAAHPGSVNAVPSAVDFSVDLRHPDAAALDALEAAIRSEIAAAAGAHGCVATIGRSLDMPPSAFPEPMIRTLETSAGRLGLPSMRLLSGAFHDALWLSRIAPSAMLFVPCRDGLSHNEAEFAAPGGIAAGAAVLGEAVCALALSDD